MPRGKAVTKRQTNLIKKLYKDELSSEKIGMKVGLSHSAVLAALKRMKVSIRPAHMPLDSLSAFKFYFNKVKQSKSMASGKSYGPTNLTIENLKELWDSQNGICKYTKLNMILQPSARSHNKKEYHPRNASLDRIDSSKGYIKGNIEFVCMAVNYAKNDFTKKEMLNFFDQIRKQTLNSSPSKANTLVCPKT